MMKSQELALAQSSSKCHKKYSTRMVGEVYMCFNYASRQWGGKNHDAFWRDI